MNAITYIFICLATANPEPLLTWYRDELPIESNDRYRIEKNTIPGRCNLIIGCIEFVDQAEWKCIAVNDFGSCATSCFLKLLIPRHYKKPRFLESLQAILTDEGAVNLECKVIGVPQPVLKWYKDGVELKPGDIHRIISGQDGTCCLGTYTCEAKNCMGIVASSASVLGFDDAAGKSALVDHALQRKLSLSTINEERTSQMYETPGSDITIDEKGDISFSFDGKEVSVSLYETPDLTEEEAMQIVEMYADQISENITEQNIVELPPLRFMKETQQSGNLLMEAVIIDVSPDYFTHEEDLRTDAGMDDISLMEVTLHGVSEIDSELNGNKSKRDHFKKIDSFPSGEADEYFSLSQSRISKPDFAAGDADEDTETDLQTFASAKSSEKQKQLSVEKEIVIHQEQLKEAIKETEALMEADAKLSVNELNSKISDSELSKSKEDDIVLRDISGEEGDGLCVKQIHETAGSTEDSQKNLHLLIPLAKCLGVIQRHICVIEDEVVMQSGMMMSQSSADGSMKILKNISEPLNATQRKLNVYSGHTPLEHLFSTLTGHMKDLQQALAVIEKCVSMDEVGHTMVQRTSVCVVDSTGQQIINALDIIRNISGEFKQSQFRDEIDLIANDMQTGIRITQDTIKSQALMQEALAIEAAQHFTDTIVKMQKTDEPQFDLVSKAKLPPEANVLKEVCRSVIRIQSALGKIEESDEESYIEILEQLLMPIENLNSEIQNIEERLDLQTGTANIVEEKICIAILDAIRPPMYELQKTLLNLSQQRPSTNELGRIQILDAIFPPLQEIQNGLARIGQDVEQGAIDRGSPIENIDSNRLLKSIAQSILYLDSNIETLPPVAATKQLKHKMVIVKTDLSQLIETITLAPEGLNQVSIEILAALRKPIDDLNYCLRQNEQRSSSKCLGDLIGPISELKEKTRQCQEIILLATPKPTTHGLVSILENINKHLVHIEKELMTSEPDMSEKSQANEAIIILNELQHCIDALPEFEYIENLASVKDMAGIESLKQLVKPLQEIQQHLTEIVQIEPIENLTSTKATNLKEFEQFAKPMQEIINTLKIITQCNVEEQAESLSSLVFNENSFAKPIQELTNCLALIKQEELLLDSSKPMSAQEIVAKATASFVHLQTCLENVIHQIVEPSLDDLSTMDNISAMKTLADDITEDGNILLDAILPKSTTGILKEPKEFIDDIKKCVGNAVEHSSILEQLETLTSDDELSDLKMLVQPIRALQKSILVQEQICVQQANDLSSQDQFSMLKEIAKPCIDLRKNIASIEMQTKLDIAEALSQREDLRQSAQCVIELLQSLHQFHIEDLDHISTFTDDDISLLQTWANESLAQYSVNDKPNVIEPKLIILIRNLKNNIESKQTTNTAIVEKLNEFLTINDNQQYIDINLFVKNVAEVIENFSENISYSDMANDLDVEQNLIAVKATLSNMAPACVTSIMLRGVNSTITNCLNETISLQQPQIKLVQQSLDELMNGLAYLSQNSKIEEFVSRNTPEIQHFVSSLQQVDSQLYFLQNDLKTKSNGAELLCVINELKLTLINVQNNIQDIDKLELVGIANKIQPVNDSLIKLYAIVAEIGNTPFEDIIEIEPNIEIVASPLLEEEKSAEDLKLDDFKSEDQLEENKSNLMDLKISKSETNENEPKNVPDTTLVEATPNEDTQPVSNVEIDNQPQTSDTPKIVLSSEESGKDIVSEIRDIVHKSEERELTPEEKDKLTTLLSEINVLGTKIHEAIIDAPIINDNTEYIINKMKEQELAEELLRKSEDRELTPEEMDTLKTLLAKINSLGCKIHETIVDAKIINESTADIINQLKDQVKQEDQLKKNANSSADTTNEEVLSCDDGTNIGTDKNIVESPTIESIPDSPVDVKEKLEKPVENVSSIPESQSKELLVDSPILSETLELQPKQDELIECGPCLPVPLVCQPHQEELVENLQESTVSHLKQGIFVREIPISSASLESKPKHEELVEKVSISPETLPSQSNQKESEQHVQFESINIITEHEQVENIKEMNEPMAHDKPLHSTTTEYLKNVPAASQFVRDPVDNIQQLSVAIRYAGKADLLQLTTEETSEKLLEIVSEYIDDKTEVIALVNQEITEIKENMSDSYKQRKPNDDDSQIELISESKQIDLTQNDTAELIVSDVDKKETTIAEELAADSTTSKNISPDISPVEKNNEEINKIVEVEVKSTISEKADLSKSTICQIDNKEIIESTGSQVEPLTQVETVDLQLEDKKDVESEKLAVDNLETKQEEPATSDSSADIKISDENPIPIDELIKDTSKSKSIHQICQETKTSTKMIDDLLAKSDSILKSIDIESLIAVSAPLEHLNSLVSKFEDQLSKNDVMNDSSLTFTLNRSLNRILRNISIAQESLSNNYGRRKLLLEISQMAIPLHELRINIEEVQSILKTTDKDRSDLMSQFESMAIPIRKINEFLQLMVTNQIDAKIIDKQESKDESEVESEIEGKTSEGSIKNEEKTEGDLDTSETKLHVDDLGLKLEVDNKTEKIDLVTETSELDTESKIERKNDSTIEKKDDLLASELSQTIGDNTEKIIVPESDTKLGKTISYSIKVFIFTTV